MLGALLSHRGGEVFCPSEVLCVARSDSSGRALQRDGLELTPEAAILTLHRPKTIQRAWGHRV